ncbi:hypothetical protein [Roseibium sp.]|uniref:hypothetical protein n=1 Tax=Roseibium sp. TaxID=1936156 RepID=UPI003A9843E2
MSIKRDKTYYKRRLKAEHPALARDVAAGKLTLWDAAHQTGLKPRPKAINGLKQHWHKATSAERDEFLKWLASEYAITCVAGTTAPVSSPALLPSRPTAVTTGLKGATGFIVHPDGRLLADVKTAIETVLASRKIKAGVMMKEMGFSPYDPSIAYAIYRDTAIQNPDLIRELEEWLKAHGHGFP